MNCPNCGFNNSWYGTQAYIVCANCGATYTPHVIRELTDKEKKELEETFEKIRTNDITLLIKNILKQVSNGKYLIYAKKYPSYDNKELEMIKQALPLDAKVYVVKRIKDISDTYVSIIKDRFLSKNEQEMYKIVIPSK